MFDPVRLLQQMVGGALGGAIGGRTRGRRSAGGIGSALGVGKAQIGLGLLGVAFAAYDHYSKSQASPKVSATPSVAPLMAPPAPPPAIATTPPPPPPGMSAPTRAQPMLDLKRQEAALLVRAMIAAAAADGLIDDQERQRIVERAQGAGDDPDTLAYLQAELARPAELAELVAQTPRSLADQVYAAAAMAIAIDTEVERAWLDELAAGLRLDDSRRQLIHAELGLA